MGLIGHRPDWVVSLHVKFDCIIVATSAVCQPPSHCSHLNLSASQPTAMCDCALQRVDSSSCLLFPGPQPVALSPSSRFFWGGILPGLEKFIQTMLFNVSFRRLFSAMIGH